MIDQVGRRKRHIVVAVLAYIGGVDMCRMLARCIGAVMTADAVVGDVGVIKVRRNPRVRRMAVVATIATRDMCRVLAGRGGAVVAGEAGADDLGVIDQVGRREGHHVVAVLAHEGGVDVCCTLAGRLHTIVTAGAVPRNARMIEIGG